MIIHRLLTVLALALTIAPATHSQNLKRQAQWDFRLSQNDNGEIVARAVRAGSPVEKAGLKDSDVILSLNGFQTATPDAALMARNKIMEGDPVSISIKRAGKTIRVAFRAVARPLEKMDGVETLYSESKTNYGYYVRTITTRPVGASGKLPGILFVPWLSCDQVEINRENMDGWAQLIQDLATKSGMAFMRVEKPGLGDSQGPDCANCDLNEDLAAFRAGFTSFKRMAFVDSTKLFVVGGSIGGALAAILMKDEPLKGIVIANTFGRSWFEHFMDFERTRMELLGTSFPEINESMTLFSEFYVDYLIKKATPKTIIESKPHLKSIWYDGPTSQFGRPSQYHQQLQNLDVAGAMSKLSCPALVVFGEFDWIMSRPDHEYITHVINKSHPGRAELIVIPGMDHHFSVYKTREEAFEGSTVNYAQQAFSAIHKWMLDKLK